MDHTAYATPPPVNATLWNEYISRQVTLSAKITKVTNYQGSEALEVTIPGNSTKYVIFSDIDRQMRALVGRSADFVGTINSPDTLIDVEEVIPFATDLDLDLVDTHAKFLVNYSAVLTSPVGST
ncbi:hypothetical protein P9112_000932 [Eukaryota sp. TZLM1-RC]